MASQNTPATEDQIEAREKKILEYEQKEFLAQHLILSSTSPHLSQKILNLTSAKEMWDAVKLDATTKSSLHQVDVLNQFKKMTERCEYLHVTNSSVSDPTYISIIISSMPEMYRPTIQTVETTMKVTGKPIDPSDLIAIFIQEAEHRVIANNQAKIAEAAMVASQATMRTGKKNGKGKNKGKSSVICNNCQKPGHKKDDCFHPGGGKEGQAPSHWNLGKKKKESANIAKAEDEDEIFAFVCTSDFKALATNLKVDTSKTDTIIDSGASRHFCPLKASE